VVPVADVEQRPVRRSLRCLVGWHHWLRRDNGEGRRYLQCRDCGKDEDPGNRTHGVAYPQ
jgi:hypothetical protein